MDKPKQIIAKFEPLERGWFYYLKGNLICRTPQNNYKGSQVESELNNLDNKIPQTIIFYSEKMVHRMLSESRFEVHKQYEAAFDDADLTIQRLEKEIDSLHSEVQRLSGNRLEVESMKKTKISFRPVNQS